METQIVLLYPDGAQKEWPPGSDLPLHRNKHSLIIEI